VSGFRALVLNRPLRCGRLGGRLPQHGLGWGSVDRPENLQVSLQSAVVLMCGFLADEDYLELSEQFCLGLDLKPVEICRDPLLRADVDRGSFLLAFLPWTVRGLHLEAVAEFHWVLVLLADGLRHLLAHESQKEGLGASLGFQVRLRNNGFEILDFSCFKLDVFHELLVKLLVAFFVIGRGLMFSVWLEGLFLDALR
jgi:hypothetical protein